MQTLVVCFFPRKSSLSIVLTVVSEILSEESYINSRTIKKEPALEMLMLRSYLLYFRYDDWRHSHNIQKKIQAWENVETRPNNAVM